jgi:hypothetical protein
MRLILPSASATAVFAVSLSFVEKIKSTNSAVASIVDKITNSKENLHDTHGNHHVDECSFVNSGEQHVQPDIGILCSNPNHVCIEDSTSSRGGRCVDLGTTIAEERDLQSCVKCAGNLACANLTQAFIDNNVGCDSCNGYKACMGVTRELDCIRDFLSKFCSRLVSVLTCLFTFYAV